MGLSEFSESISVIAADIPNTIAKPNTTITGALRSDVNITWTKPYDGGAPILSYTVLI